MKFFYVRTDDDRVVEIPENHLRLTLSIHKKWAVIDESTDIGLVNPLVETPTQPKLICPICGLESVSEHGLKVHKARKH